MTDTLQQSTQDLASQAASTDDVAAVAAAWVAALGAALERGSAPELEALFAEDASWRDFMAFTWDFSHKIGRAELVPRLLELAKAAEARDFRLNTDQPAFVFNGEIAAFFDFTTRDRVDRGHVRLSTATGRPLATVFQSQVEGLQGHPERIRHHRPTGKVHGNVPNRTRWSADRQKQLAFEDSEPAVLVLGAGHNGLSIAARLQALDVPTLVIDREARVGDTWRKRYASLALHSSVYGDHLPYLPLPPTWTEHTPKDKFAEFLESYVTLLDLNVWTSTTFVNAHYDESAQRWTVRVRREDGSIRELHPRHFVVAAGLYGNPRIPAIKGLETFTGVYTHSDAFQDGDRHPGKTALVVGAGVSGHEIAHDLAEHGTDVTLLQRSSTYVVDFPTYHKIWAGLFHEDTTVPPDYADQMAYALPNALSDELQKKLVKLAAKDDQELLDALVARGFKLDWGADGGGIYGSIAVGKDSYHINIGAAQLIADGTIKVKQGVELVEIRDGRTGVFSDGSELQLDLIVFATGYDWLWASIRPTLGTAAARIDKAYGRAADGEYANTWRRSAQPGLWFGTGFIRMARYYSKFMALQIKAIEEGIEPVDPGEDPAWAARAGFAPHDRADSDAVTPALG
ncbi:NAD(P)/FAD-dependent oxidoreductase [Blastococcus sp. URHD0036]|uniref:flavin-containing monooxygenase n=1 Tax=Blastococcus sp. URHD0036 TaxID=1380356 RepID=UPI0009DE57C8|nr:NAD(P)/FAD-dependent oxidoreductase [Blastococcus sp. URHD0036]